MDPGQDRDSTAGAVGPIGICLSGGGYRATAFHLGALSYLHQLELDAELIMLSSVSGGTFAGTRYAVSQVSGETFQEFFDALYSFLERTDLVELGLRRLAEGSVDVPSGRQDLIVSVAEIYADTFLAKEGGAPWLFGDVLDALAAQQTTLKEVVFNSTEFRYGMDFRFQSSGPVGNGNISIPRELAAELRLADITAMSSCFPGGFEPVAFPFDVHWPGGQVPRAVGDAYFTADGVARPLPIMDGGIYDNQGLDALMKANKRAGYPLETVIISDVDQVSDDLFPYPELGRPTGPTLNAAVKAGWILALLSALTFGVVAIDLVRGLSDSAGILRLLASGTGLLLSGVTFGVLFWLRRELRTALKRLPQVGLHAWNDLRHLKLELLGQMLHLRGSALLVLSSSVFMKRVRSLVFRRFYSDDRVRDTLVSNLIYKLTLERERRQLSEIPGVKLPAAGSKLERVAKAAESMATTLWFVEGRGWCQPSLVASGQATLAYALLQNLFRRYGGVPRTGAAAKLWPRLLTDTERFQDNPYWLLESLRPGDYPSPPADCSCAQALSLSEAHRHGTSFEP